MSTITEAIDAMERAKELSVWDHINHALHVELDVIFKYLAATQAPSAATIKDSLTVQAPSAPVARNMSAEFEAWAKREGLIQESHGIRSTSSACAVAQRAFDAGAALSVKAGPAETVASVCGVDYVMVRRDAIDWLKAKNPAICEKSGLCEKIGGRLYTRTCGGWNEVAAPTPPTTGEA